MMNSKDMVPMTFKVEPSMIGSVTPPWREERPRPTLVRTEERRATARPTILEGLPL